ncbi:phytoene/squalene synthase family protein [bacterium]|nr:phytoene/squalene synthase family protein [bacterium]
MKALFDRVSLKASKMVTRQYSTSFSLGIYCLESRFHDPIYAIYGFVRLADEIVDSFHDHPKRELLDRFEEDTWKAIEQGISLNPILHSFQGVVRQYQMNTDLIRAFLHSMRMDLDPQSYDRPLLDEYVYGSAEVVGLMCLSVFCEGDVQRYAELVRPARKLGSAFQKINFLRDLKADGYELGRVYFPNVDLTQFDRTTKKAIESEIESDFAEGYQGILALPKGARFGVYIAYVYYFALLNRIKNTPAEHLLNQRIRIPNQQKYTLLLRSYVKHSLNLL